GQVVVNSSQGGGSKDTWVVGGSAPAQVEYGQGAALVGDEAATVTEAIPIIYDDQPEQVHSPQDLGPVVSEQQEQQQQALRHAPGGRGSGTGRGAPGGRGSGTGRGGRGGRGSATGRGDPAC